MKLISIFNNKGGVGKTTLTFHVAHALATMGHRVLMMDFDPQCNLTIYGMEEDDILKVWQDEDSFIEDFDAARKKSRAKYRNIIKSTRSSHFIVKPVEDGVEDLENLPPPRRISDNLDLLPGRLSLFSYESRISTRWSDLFRGDPLAIRTVMKIRDLAEDYATQYGYDFIIIDTSPSIGDLNKVIISTVDGFLIPAMPDMFSVYGIQNIGRALDLWRKDFKTLFQILTDAKRKRFPDKFVQFIGYTIYNAKRYEKKDRPGNRWALAKAHYNFAQQIPTTVRKYIDKEVWSHLTSRQLESPIGGISVMHTHNTFPSLAQKYHAPMWELPNHQLIEESDRPTIIPNRKKFHDTLQGYESFCIDLLKRIP